MAIVPAFGQAPPHAALEAAARGLDGGFVVGLPTDTVYGLVADVSYTGAADRLFAIKQRSRDYELPVIVSDIEQAKSIAIGVTDAAERLMEKFWPGALTIILPRHPEFVADLGSDDETVGVRCPDHLIPRALCDEVGPLAITTANLHGSQRPATTAQEVAETFGEAVPLVLDGGECDGQIATVVDVTGTEPKLLREGRILWTDIEAALR